MKVFQWDNAKNEWLKENRGVCFEEVVILLERENVLEIVNHPNQNKYPGQKIATIKIGDYAGKDFIATFKTENLKLVPDDYDVEVQTGAFAKFENKAGNLKYFIALETK